MEHKYTNRQKQIKETKFYKLTPIEIVRFEGNIAVWNTVCDCGAETEIRQDYLVQGVRRSCYECTRKSKDALSAEQDLKRIHSGFIGGMV